MVFDGVFIGIGANLGDRKKTLQEAVLLLNAESNVSVVAVSSVYETDPVGVLDQPKFLNAVLQIETDFCAQDLLDCLLAVEKRFGRVRKIHWGPRTLDLDILFFRDAIIHQPGLKVPHPHLHEREFVLVPLCDLVPDVIHPILNESLHALAKSLPQESHVRKIEGFKLKIKK